jgi:hypothetical protein
MSYHVMNQYISVSGSEGKTRIQRVKIWNIYKLKIPSSDLHYQNNSTILKNESSYIGWTKQS